MGEVLIEKKERPILFSTPMVQAILEGRKTMTRRVIKPQQQLTSAMVNKCCIRGIMSGHLFNKNYLKYQSPYLHGGFEIQSRRYSLGKRNISNMMGYLYRPLHLWR
jgi:hypothetical protein